jgi:hypothetical protein
MNAADIKAFAIGKTVYLETGVSDRDGWPGRTLLSRGWHRHLQDANRRHLDGHLADEGRHAVHRMEAKAPCAVRPVGQNGRDGVDHRLF